MSAILPFIIENIHSMKNILFIACVAILVWSCSLEQDHSHQDDAEHQPVESDQQETESVTLYSKNFEVFAEFGILKVGQKSDFLIHVTELNQDYCALTGGNVKVVLNVNGQIQSKVAEQTQVGGIYSLEIVPKDEGSGILTFDIQSDSIRERLSKGHIHIYEENATDIHHHGSSASNLVKYTKEQAWSGDFNLVEVQVDSFSRVITASGEFLAMPGEKQSVVANSQGIVLFETRNLVQGQFVNKNDVLFTISSEGLAENNIMVRYNEARINFEQSKGNFNRHDELYKERIISEKQFLESKSEYITDSINFYSLKRSAGSDGMKVLAPRSGYIHELNVSEGQFVESGNLMATISANKVILLKADLPQQYFNELGKIITTNFRPAYTTRVYTLEELSGKLIARGASVAENNHYMPIYFEVNNDGTILEGAFSEFYLKTIPEPGHIVLPVNSLIEELGNYYVYVQVTGEEYQKRSIKLLANDGIKVSVASGLEVGERVVSEGAMLLKMASSSSMPVHSHSH